MLPVIIRADKEGETFALFPTIQHHAHYVTCYTSWGHCAADYDLCIQTSRPATKAETDAMLKQLAYSRYERLKVCYRRSAKMRF